MCTPDHLQLDRVRVLRAAAYRCQYVTRAGVECGRPASLVGAVQDGTGAVCRGHAPLTSRDGV